MPFIIGLLFCFQNGESAWVQHSFLNDSKDEEIWVRFFKVILFISCWSVYFSIVLDVCDGHVEKKCKGTFPQARSFIKVKANWNIFGMHIWFAALFCLGKCARYRNKCCIWELHFPWGNAMECTCVCMVIVERM